MGLVLFLIAGLAEGMMDWLQFRLNVSHAMYDSMFWNPEFSWRNKWKDRIPALGEAFWQSSRLFVFVTDGWHLMKFTRNIALYLGILHIAICDITVIQAVITVVLARIMYGLGFSLSFSWIHKIF